MFHICFNSSREYINYVAALINNVIQKIDVSKNFKDFCNEEILNTYSHKNHDYLKTRNPKDLDMQDFEEGCVFHVLHSDYIEHDIKGKFHLLGKELSNIYPCEILFHKVDESIFKKENLSPWQGSYATYYKLILTRFIDKVDTILYLDLDLYINCDIRELFAIDLQDNVLAGADIAGIYKGYFKNILDNSEVIIPLSNWLNVGILLINLKYFKEDEAQDKIKKTLETYLFDSVPDEAVLNIVFPNRLRLPVIYNFCIGFLTFGDINPQDYYNFEKYNGYFLYSVDFYENFLSKAKVIHYCFLSAKPWGNRFAFLSDSFLPARIPCIDLWWNSALKTPYFDEYFVQLKNEISSKELELYSNNIHKVLLNMHQKLIGLENAISSNIVLNEQKIEKQCIVKDYKSHLSYQLGQALIKAYKNKWGGGFIKFPFEAYSIVKKWKKEKGIK